MAEQAAADEARYRKLLADGWATQQKHEQAKAMRDSTAAQLAATEAQAEVARHEAAYSTLFADADGTVVETLAEPGQVLAAGQIVIKLAHAGPREATVNLPETVRPAIGSSAQARTYGTSAPPSPPRCDSSLTRPIRQPGLTRRATCWKARRRVRHLERPSRFG